MATFATSVPVAYALWPTSTQYLGSEIPWGADPNNSLQRLMITLKDPSLALASTMDNSVLRACASNSAAVVNKFLRDEKFTIQLTDAGSLNMLYCAAVMKLLGKFLVPGTSGYYLSKIGKKAFRLGRDSGIKHYMFRPQIGESFRIVEVPTMAGFSLLVARPTGVTGWDMLIDWSQMTFFMKEVEGNGVILPSAQIDEAKVDVKALVGMTGGEWMIQEALMAAKFGLTRKEVKFEAAFAFSAKRAVDPRHDPEPDDYVADHDLYFALVRQGHILPIAVGLIPSEELSDASDVE
ncbi:MAG: hypothetical protein UW35_C0029G0002 [Candidatus Collierbacteria bacterium GW2011_GWF2_44_15]|uniref:Uncharacterized protein n=2 Tax=Candidatus Collieribacteriota TaxID=1752725 RepID=A0A0G1JPE8_9BACT|nr:MAG: hypothetical protein UW35_C0029G0002 [Candidatus Collierbacteria bacterium GW2011_GWF2_44_15]HBA36308.1 hypothetical protein [Candidatus Falkowbacteria bacterium]